MPATPKYNNYISSCEDVTRSYLKKTYATKSDRKKAGMKEALSYVCHTFPQFFHTLDGKIIIEEWLWLKAGRKTIFPATQDTLDMINRGHVELVSSEGLSPPMNPFVIATPRGFTVNGLPCASILVSIYNAHQRLENYVSFANYVGLPGDSLREIYREELKDAGDECQKVITFSYRSPIDSNIARLSINFVDLPSILAVPNVDIFKKEVIPGLQIVQTVGMNDIEIDQQRLVLKLIVRLLVYMQATHCLESGLPATYQEDDAGLLYSDYHMKPKGTILKLAHTVDTGIDRTAHYRSFFIRQLRDERFYKGEHANQERGSRFVFVKDTYVGADVEANTLVERDGIDA